MKYLKSIFLVMLLFFTCACASEQKQAVEQVGNDANVGIKYVRQIVAEDNKTARMLMWASDVKQEYSVEYRKQGEKSTHTLSVRDASFQDAKEFYIQYKVEMTGLDAGNTYEYRINTKTHKGTWHTLKTEAGEKFTALIFPDSQSSDYSGWKNLARAAQKRHAEASFFVNMGDLVDNGQHAAQWRAWFNSVEPFSAEMPLAPVIGNHEAYSLDWQEVQPVAYPHLFEVPKNGSKAYPNQFYSFDYGDVHFVVLDTNFYEMEKFQPQLLQDELAWLEQDLARAKAKWKVVLQHRDVFIYGFGPESGRAQTKTHFLDFSYQLIPVFEKYGVDAVLSAHLHTYRRRVPLRNFVPDERGITYILTGVAGNVRYPKLWGDFEWDAGVAPKPETANYMTMEASKDALAFRAYLEDGTQFDEVVLKK